VRFRRKKPCQAKGIDAVFGFKYGFGGLKYVAAGSKYGADGSDIRSALTYPQGVAEAIFVEAGRTVVRRL
jgi:hypothetical protein